MMLANIPGLIAEIEAAEATRHVGNVDRSDQHDADVQFGAFMAGRAPAILAILRTVNAAVAPSVERIVTREDELGTLHLPHLWCDKHQAWEPMLKQSPACRQDDARVASVRVLK